MSEREKRLAEVLGELVLRYSQMVGAWTPDHVLIVERAKEALAMPIGDNHEDRQDEPPPRGLGPRE